MLSAKITNQCIMATARAILTPPGTVTLSCAWDECVAPTTLWWVTHCHSYDIYLVSIKPPGTYSTSSRLSFLAPTSSPLSPPALPLTVSNCTSVSATLLCSSSTARVGQLLHSIAICRSTRIRLLLLSRLGTATTCVQNSRQQRYLGNTVGANISR